MTFLCLWIASQPLFQLLEFQYQIISNIRRLTSQLENDNNYLTIHWIPGHKESEGYKRADRLAKEVAKEMEGKMKDSMTE